MPIGTMTVPMRAENWAALSAGDTPIYVDEGQIALQKELGEYLLPPPESSVGNVVHMAGTMPWRLLFIIKIQLSMMKQLTSYRMMKVI